MYTVPQTSTGLKSFRDRKDRPLVAFQRNAELRHLCHFTDLEATSIFDIVYVFTRIQTKYIRSFNPIKNMIFRLLRKPPGMSQTPNLILFHRCLFISQPLLEGK